MSIRFSRWIAETHLGLRRTEHIYMVALASVIGVLGGLGSVVFRRFIEVVQHGAWRTDHFSLDAIRELPIYWTILVPAVGGLLVGLIIHRFASEAKGHGVPEVMEAVALRGGRIRPRVVIAKLVASGICIASGGSVGREGPIVQIGASIGSAVGQVVRVGERRLRTLVGAGAAAGIAGTFNAPVAGALFAAEVILGDFGVSQFSPIVIAAVLSTVVAHQFVGDEPAFLVPEYSLVSAQELIAYAALGLVAGLVAIAFIRMLYAAEDLFDKVRIPGPLKAMGGGAIIGIIGTQFPEIFGVGYEAIDQVLLGKMALGMLLALCVVKLFAVGITIGSGGSGGIFAPSLFIGAMAGGAVGTVVHGVWPDATGGPGAYALVGMGGVVAAATHAPITAILIIFELTSDYKIILPLMITCTIATLLAMRIQDASIYTLKLLRRGVDIWGGRTVNVLRDLHTRDIMRDDFVTVSRKDSLMVVASRFIEHPGDAVFVTDEEGGYFGVITFQEIRPILGDLESMEELLIAEDMVRPEGVPIFRPDDTLDRVMRRFGGFRFEAPVLSDGRLVGVVRPEDVIRSYNAEVFKREMASSMAQTLSVEPSPESLPGVRGMSIVEVAVPPEFVGKSLADLDIRKRFDATVLLIKRKTSAGEEVVNQLPDADYVFQAGDQMLVMGAETRLRRLERICR